MYDNAYATLVLIIAGLFILFNIWPYLLGGLALITLLVIWRKLK